MGAIGGLIGLGSGAAGTNFTVANPVGANGGVNAASNQVQGALQSQQGLLSALQGQNGIGNQSQVYGQLQGIASGAVNPAQAQFAQNTQQNVANQAALMAGQRGASANVGLMARQAAQQGAATQQQAVGQEATQQATDQINAIGAAGNLATQQAGQQIGATTANTQANLGNQGQLLGAVGQYNAAQAGLANTQMQGQQGIVGGLMNAMGPTLASVPPAPAPGAGGGEIVKLADGGDIGWTNAPTGGGQGMYSFTPMAPATQSLQMGIKNAASKAKSSFGQFLQGSQTPTQNNGAAQNLSDPTAQTGYSQNNPDVIGGTADDPSFAKGGMIKDLSSGGKVKATSADQKADKKGNNYGNDKIPAVLSEHEIVLPRSVTLSKDPVGNAAKFVSAVIAKRGGRK